MLSNFVVLMECNPVCKTWDTCLKSYLPACSMFGVRISPGLGEGLPGPLAAGFWFAPPLSVVPGGTDGAGGVVGDSDFCSAPILLGARLGIGGGGGGGSAEI